jgi:hypothetical protein
MSSDFINVVDDFWSKDTDIDLNLTRGLIAIHEERLKYPSYSHPPTFKDWVSMKNMYIPPPGRSFYYDSIDLRNDGPPQNCSLVGMGDFFRYYETTNKYWYGYSSGPPTMAGLTLSIQKRKPKECRLILKNDPIYKITLWEYFENGIPEYFADGETARKVHDKGKIRIDKDHVCVRTMADFFQINKTGQILKVNRPAHAQVNHSYIKEWAAWANCAHYDKRHLWRVFLVERYKGSILGLLEFGVDQEKVKSILYARELPVTIEGRKRPILHWVTSHKRRIKEGIEIDIEKHLRGINKFSMFGNEFFIAHPTKKGSEAEIDEIEDYYDLISSCPNTFGVPPVDR